MLKERIPTEFRYWENINTPWAQRRRKALKLVLGADPKLPDAAVRDYARSYYDADPVAEAFIEDVYMKQGQKAGRAMVDQALADGVDAVKDAPASMKTLFAELENDPDWLDWDQVELGAKTFRRYGTRMFSFAGAITLHGYLENSVAKPLAFTGAYNGDSANRRFLETASFWLDVGAPGGMRPGAPGVKTAMKVRLMHVFVRKRLLQHPEWDLDAWGVPISQGDALLTLMGGSFVPGMLMRVMGYRTSSEEIEAMMHFWRYVGHVMGVQPRFYPKNIQEAAGLMLTSDIKGVRGAGDDGIELSRSYVESYRPTGNEPPLERLEKWLEYVTELGYVRLFIPGKTYRHHGLPPAGPLRFYPIAQAPLIFALETARKRSRWADRMIDRAARASAKRWVDRRLGKRSVEYQAVEQFTR